MDLKHQLKTMIIGESRLEDITPGAISDCAPLFGEGLGLDSLDSLQLAVSLEEHYGIRIRDESEGRVAFASIDALATFVGSHRKDQAVG